MKDRLLKGQFNRQYLSGKRIFIHYIFFDSLVDLYKSRPQVFKRWITLSTGYCNSFP